MRKFMSPDAISAGGSGETLPSQADNIAAVLSDPKVVGEIALDGTVQAPVVQDSAAAGVAATPTAVETQQGAVETNAAGGGQPVAQAPAPAAVDSGNELETLRAQNTQLQQQMKSMMDLMLGGAGQGAEQGLVQETPIPQPVQAQPMIGAATVAQIPAENMQYVSEQEFMQAMTDVGAFNGLLNKIANTIREKTLQQSMGAVAVAAKEESRRQLAAMEFYRNNPGLVAHRDKVGMIANTIAAKKPHLTFEALLAETATVAKTLLGVGSEQAPQGMQQVQTARPPVAVPVGGGRPAGPSTLTPIQKQIASLLGD